MKEDLAHIVAACKAQNRSAQKELYQRFCASFYAIVFRYIGNEDDAKDILHDAFIQIFTNINQLKNNEFFPAWSKKIVVNESLHHLKKKKKVHFEEWQDRNEAEDTDDQDFVEQYANITQEILYEKIAQMPNAYRLVFNLYFIENYSHQDISTALNISIGTSKSNLHKAKKWLQKACINANLVCK